MSEARDIVKMGAHLSAFAGGHTASLHVKGSGGATWTATASVADDNPEALRRVLTAALCWLDDQQQLVMPAVRGDVVMRPERREG